MSGRQRARGASVGYAAVPAASVAGLFLLLALSLLALYMAGVPLSALALEGGAGLLAAQLAAQSAVLALTALATSVAFQAGLRNLGAEGQMIAGALLALATAALLPFLPAPVVAGLALIAGALAGALLLALTAWLKNRSGADEAVITLLTNVIATLCLGMAAGVAPSELAPTGLHKSFSLSGMPIAAVSAEVGGALFAGLTLALCVLTWAMLRASVAGFVIRTTGGNALAAKLSGVSIGRVWFRVGLFAGGCAGLAGAALVAAFNPGPQETFVTGAGYGGIAVALLAQGSPVRILYWAPAVAIVARFADVIARASSLPSSTVDLVTAALIVIGLIATSIGQGRRHRRVIPS